jgi:hypothetical protein
LRHADRDQVLDDADLRAVAERVDVVVHLRRAEPHFAGDLVVGPEPEQPDIRVRRGVLDLERIAGGDRRRGERRADRGARRRDGVERGVQIAVRAAADVVNESGQHVCLNSARIARRYLLIA